MRLLVVPLVAFALSAPACSDDGGAAPAATPADDAVAPDSGDRTTGPIRCENACKRAPRCSPDLVTEADCVAICQQDDDPQTYACCIQYADNCAAVESCITGTNRVCDPQGEPWVPLSELQECTCGLPDEPTPKSAECKESAPDHPCLTGMCLKPVNWDLPPFCATDCTGNAGACKAPLTCEDTPKTDYCSNPFAG